MADNDEGYGNIVKAIWFKYAVRRDTSFLVASKSAYI